MSTGKKAARVGAAAFALGVCLAGPQAGVAAADASDDGSSASAADSNAAPSRTAGPTSRAAGGASRSAGLLPDRVPAPAAAAPAPAASTSSSSTKRSPFYGKALTMFGPRGVMGTYPLVSACAKIDLSQPFKGPAVGLAGPGKQCQAK